MPVYLIAQITIHDRSSYDKYDDGFFEVWEKYDGEVLSVDEAPTILDGQHLRNILNSRSIALMELKHAQ